MTGGTPKDVPLFLWLQDKAGIDPARYENTFSLAM